jgi:hypothetical protein
MCITKLREQSTSRWWPVHRAVGMTDYVHTSLFALPDIAHNVGPSPARPSPIVRAWYTALPSVHAKARLPVRTLVHHSRLDHKSERDGAATRPRHRLYCSGSGQIASWLSHAPGRCEPRTAHRPHHPIQSVQSSMRRCSLFVLTAACCKGPLRGRIRRLSAFVPLPVRALSRNCCRVVAWKNCSMGMITPHLPLCLPTV